jgi:hypothetical protein
MYHKNEVSSERARALLFDSDIIQYIGEKPAPGEDGERVWKDDTRQALITSALQAYPNKPPLAPFLIEATMKLAQTEAHPDSEEKAQSTLAKAMKMLSQTDALVDPHLVDTYAAIQAYLPHTGSETEQKQYRADVSLILSKSVKSADYNRICKEQLAVHDDPAHSLAEYESDNLNSAHRVRNSMQIVSLLHRIGNGIPGLDGSPASQRAQVMQKRVWQEVRWLDL